MQRTIGLVSLTSIVCKTLEHVLSSCMMSHLEQNYILTNAQFGFRKRRSSNTQLTVTLQDLASNLDVGGQTDVILLDSQKHLIGYLISGFCVNYNSMVST